ncbi:unnamed protein product, partial [Mesorhabditis spiculigera]
MTSSDMAYSQFHLRQCVSQLLRSSRRYPDQYDLYCELNEQYNEILFATDALVKYILQLNEWIIVSNEDDEIESEAEVDAQIGAIVYLSRYASQPMGQTRNLTINACSRLIARVQQDINNIKVFAKFCVPGQMRVKPTEATHAAHFQGGPEPSRSNEKPTGRLLAVSALSVLGGGFHFGYQMAIINPMAGVLQEFLSIGFHSRYGIQLDSPQLSWVWSATAGLLFIGAAIGAGIAATVIDRRGPATTLLYAAIWLMIAGPLCGISSFLEFPEFFILGRFLSGIGIGVGTTAHGVFLAEISPTKFRGIIGSFGGFSTNIGYIIASALGLPFVLGEKAHWPVAFVLESLPSIVLIVGSISIFHESPVFLLKQNHEEAARQSLAAYHGKQEKDELERLRFELKEHAKSENWADFFRDRVSRRALLLSCLLNIVVAFSGITAVSFFGTFLLQSIGFSGISGTVGAIVATIGIDKVGRRLLVIGSLISLAIVDTLMMLMVLWFNATHNNQLGYGFLALLVVFLFLFSASIGPTAWFIGAEMAPPSSRAKVQSLSVLCQYAFCFLSPLLYYPLSTVSSSLSFLLFIVPLTSAAIFFHKWLPETKGKTPGEIAEALATGRAF